MTARDDAVAIVRVLKGHWHGDSAMCRCPAHDDRDPSLSISISDGKVLVHCHAGCGQEAVIDALKRMGLWPNGERDERRPTGARIARVGKERAEPKGKKPAVIRTRVFEYRDEAGKVLFETVRKDLEGGGKNIHQRRTDARGRTVHSIEGVRLVPYRLPELIAAIDAGEIIYIVEGEPKVSLLTTWDLASTCNSGGAGKWRPEHAEPFRRRRVRAVVLPDNDEQGRRHAHMVAESLHSVAESIKIINLPRLAPKGDIVNWAERGGTKELLLAIVNEAPEWEPSEAAAEAAEPEVAEAIDAARTEPEEEPEAEPDDPGLPTIRIVKGELPRVIDEAEDALVAADSGLYRHGGRLVRVVLDEVMTSLGPVPMLRLHPVVPAHLLEAFARAARFARFDRREKCWVAADCPALVAASYVARGEWRLPPLLGVVTAPTLRPDGTILDRPGWDPATCLLFDPQGAAFPPIPAEPTKDQAVAALEELRRPISKFDFGTAADRAVALSGILTAVARRALPAAPLHAFSSPVAGSGKSKLVNVAAVTATGKPAAVTSSGNDRVSNAELEKRIATSLMAGDAVVSIDNLDAPLGGELLCQALTERILRLRILGQSLNLEVPNTTMFFATGNQLTIAGDATRRALIATIDPMVERPELRVFDFDPVKVVEGQRGRYVAAALTVLRAYEVAGRPNPGPPLGSFNEWCARVRDPLLWLGEADPVATMEKARRGDPKLAKLAAVIAAWEPALGSTRVMTREVIGKAAERDVYGELVDPGLHEALLTVAQNRSGGGISGDRLGWWLKKNAERVVNGRRIVQDDDQDNASTWRLEALPAPGERWEH